MSRIAVNEVWSLCYKTADKPKTWTPHHSHCTVSVTGSLVKVGQVCPVPPPHTPGAVTVTVQVYKPAEEIVTVFMVVALVWLVPETAAIVLVAMDPYSNLIMAPGTSTLSTAMQVKVREVPTVPVGLAGERDADVIKLLGTEEEPSTEIFIHLQVQWNLCMYDSHPLDRA